MDTIPGYNKGATEEDHKAAPTDEPALPRKATHG